MKFRCVYPEIFIHVPKCECATQYIHYFHQASTYLKEYTVATKVYLAAPVKSM
jgi:hypothetical protein